MLVLASAQLYLHYSVIQQFIGLGYEKCLIDAVARENISVFHVTCG